MEQLGTDKLEVLIGFGLDVTKQVADSSKDGWQWTDVFAFTDEAIAAIKVVKNLKEAGQQLKDLDATERQALIDKFAEKFDLPNDKAEILIEKALNWVLMGAELVNEFKQLKQ